MMPGFGFSIGDFIAVAGLIKKVSDTLKDAGGASSDYQHVIIELEGLDKVLKVVAALEPDQSNHSHVNAIRGMALSCQLPLRQFLVKIQKYEESLGAIPLSKSITRNARKVKWAVYIADQVKSLRAVVAAKVISINLLLNVQITGAISNIEPAIRRERNYLMSEIFRLRESISEMRLDSQKAQSNAKNVADCAKKEANSQAEALVSLDDKVGKGIEEVISGLDNLSATAKSVETSVLSLRNTSKQIVRFIDNFPREVREFFQKILQTNLQLYYVLLQIQSNLTRSPSMILETNIIFEDALGRTRSLPYEWFRRWEIFEGLLKAEFKGISGESKVLDGSYHLSDNKNRGKEICKENWAHEVTPGSIILMSMIINQLRFRRGICPRSSCKKSTSNSTTSGSAITCSNCGLKYSVIKGTGPEEREILEIEDEEIYISQLQAEEDVRMFGDWPTPIDIKETDSSTIEFDKQFSDTDNPILGIVDLYFADNMDLDQIVQEDNFQNNLGSLDTSYDDIENFSFLQMEEVTPLDAWLSQVSEINIMSRVSQIAPISNSKDLESQGIEHFRNIHIIEDEDLGQIQTLMSDQVFMNDTEEIEFSARIFYRNIRDRYHHLPKYLAQRLAKANKSRSDRLGFSRIEQGERSSSDDWDEDYGGPNPNEMNKEPEISLDNKILQQEIDSDVPSIERIPLKKGRSYWSGKIVVRSPYSSISRSSTKNSSLHGSEEGPKSSSMSNSSRYEPIDDRREPLLTLPPPPIKLGTQKIFTCDICGHSVKVLRRRDWKKHVFQDLEPYMCTYEGCPIADKTYVTRRAFIKHEIRHHRAVTRKFTCIYCHDFFNRKRDARRHLSVCKCYKSAGVELNSHSKDDLLKNGFYTIEKRVADSVCPFCAKEITGGGGNLTQHLGRHLEEVSFAVVRKPYEEWQFYEDSLSAQSSVVSAVLNDNIYEATVRGDVKLVMDLLMTGADVNTETADQSLLHVASARGDHAMVWLLLQNGADHQKKSKLKIYNNSSTPVLSPQQMANGRTALEEASINGHIAVATLLAKVASDQGFQTAGENALILAAQFGQLDIVKELIRCFEIVEGKCLTSTLYFAAKEGHIEIVRFLLLNSAKMLLPTLSDAPNFYNESEDPLMATLKGGYKELSLLLLENGVYISEPAWVECGLSKDHELLSAMLAHKTNSDSCLKRMLEAAVSQDNIKIVVMLLEDGVKVTNDAVGIACSLGHSSVLNLLLDKGAVPQASDLKHAIRNGHPKIIDILLLRCPELILELESEDIIGMALRSGSMKTVGIFLKLGHALPSPKYVEYKDTLLHNAAAKGHIDIAQLLISNGFDVNAEGFGGENPLHRACALGNSEMVKLLLDAGAAVTGINSSQFRTPIECATTIEIRKMLIDRGAMGYFESIGEDEGEL